MVIADDGSDENTRSLIERINSQVDYSIQHVWQEDRGFQKSQILNKAVVECKAPYIIMSDGDCIPRADFVEQHIKYKQEGYFLSGGYFMLPMSISELISKEDIYNRNCFDINWLRKRGLKRTFKNNKLTSKGIKSAILNNITPTNASWNGHNASGWKKILLLLMVSMNGCSMVVRTENWGSA